MVLIRVLKEKGPKVDPEAVATLDAMPDTFREWVSMPPGRCFKVCSSAILGVAAA